MPQSRDRPRAGFGGKGGRPGRFGRAHALQKEFPGDGDSVERIRQALPAALSRRYFNNGSCGPLPVECQRAIAEEADRELRQGRVGSQAAARAAALHGQARAALSRVLHAPEGTVALTHHTTEGLNIAILGHEFSPGDEILTTSVEHIGALAPLFSLKERRGVRITALEVGADPAGLADLVAAAIGPRTRMMVLSHVAYATGAVLPVKRIAEICRRRNVLVVVDGAQAAGALPVDVVELGVDAYAIPGQKWLYGPEGTGALYVRRELIPTLVPPESGYASMARWDEAALTHAFHPDARRFEVGSVYLPALAGLVASLRWLETEVGLAWVHARVAALASAVGERIAALPGARVLTPPGAAGLVVFNLDAVDPQAAVAALEAQGILIRWVPRPRALRVSVAAHNDAADVEALLMALAGLCARR